MPFAILRHLLHLMEECMAASAYRQGWAQQTNGSYVAGGADYVFQSSPPISSARRHVFHSNDRAPWITSGVKRTPVGTLHSDNDNVTVPEGQWRRCSVLTANREEGGAFTVSNDNIKISGKWSRKARIDSHPSAPLGNAEVLDFISTRHAPPPSTPPELCCSRGTSPRSNVTPRYSDTGSVLHQIRNGWGDLALQNLISLRVFFCATQLSLMSARSIRPNKQAPLDGLHGCVPSWFH